MGFLYMLTIVFMLSGLLPGLFLTKKIHQKDAASNIMCNINILCMSGCPIRWEHKEPQQGGDLPPVLGVRGSLLQPHQGVAGGAQGQTADPVSPLLLRTATHTSGRQRRSGSDRSSQSSSDPPGRSRARRARRDAMRCDGGLGIAGKCQVNMCHSPQGLGVCRPAPPHYRPGWATYTRGPTGALNAVVFMSN